jgi:hypothetical protein
MLMTDFSDYEIHFGSRDYRMLPSGNIEVKRLIDAKTGEMKWVHVPLAAPSLIYAFRQRGIVAPPSDGEA